MAIRRKDGSETIGGGQAPPLVKSGVLPLAGAAPVLSPNVLKIPMLATLSCWRSGAPAGGEAAMHATAAAKAGPNLLMCFITFFLSCQVKSPGSCFLVYFQPGHPLTGDFPNLSAGFSGRHSPPRPELFSLEKKIGCFTFCGSPNLYTC